ncbi:hypothetical protein GY50_0201 [Dehalococcoides mccartyi GY50]|nr:hypothetical protein GY50_0201 [Dehalococcoides mccartyi GY50]
MDNRHSPKPVRPDYAADVFKVSVFAGISARNRIYTLFNLIWSLYSAIF